jgi:hypothetical protein
MRCGAQRTVLCLRLTICVSVLCRVHGVLAQATTAAGSGNASVLTMAPEHNTDATPSRPRPTRPTPTDVVTMALRVIKVNRPVATPQCGATEKLAATLGPGNTWPDIAYKPQPGVDTRSHWPPSIHLDRTEQMAWCLLAGVTCCRNSTGLEQIRRAADNALGWWLQAVPTNPDNWSVWCSAPCSRHLYHAQCTLRLSCMCTPSLACRSRMPLYAARRYQQYISTPLSLGRICLALNFTRPVLPRATLDQCTATITSVPVNVNPPGIDNITGGNAIWIASTQVYAGLLSQNATLVQSYLDRMWLQLATTRHNLAGVKQDGSFLQHCSPVTFGGIPLAHHAQLYSGGYGRGFTE